MSNGFNRNQDSQEIDPFTRLMFGGPPRQETKVAAEEKTLGDDYAELMEQVDSIMDSVNKLKPMLKDFSPLLEYFKNKS